MVVKIYRVLKFNDKKVSSLDSVNHLRKTIEVEVKFDQKKIKKGLIPEEYQTVQYRLEDYENLDRPLQVKEDKISKLFMPKKFVGKIRHKDIWQDSNKSIIKPVTEVFKDFEIPLAFFIKNGYLHVLILKADTEMLKKFKVLYSTAEEINSNEFDTHLFKWLFYLFDKKNGLIKDNNKITDMLGFTSSPSGKNLDLEVISGISNHVAGMDATKLEIALNHTLTSIKLTLTYKSNVLRFAIDDSLKMVIDPDFSAIGTAFSKQYLGFDNMHLFMAKGIYILCVVIPYLEVEFNKVEDFDNTYKSYRRGLRDSLVRKLLAVE